jgi:dimethylaniline monooxygenase (N-oxide forming)
MEKQIVEHHAWLIQLVKREAVASDFVREESWLKWCHDAAGTGVNENFGYRVSGWKFWLSDMSLSNVLMVGVETPFALRLFDGKRKKWDGARQLSYM